MKHVVMFSGGIGSWAAAKRVAKRHGTADMVLLFADTMTEDEDTYRWLQDAAANVGVPITRIADGRTIWQVFRDERFLGNHRVDPCSRVLKRDLSERWIAEHCDPAETVRYLGYDWTELHRLERTQRAMPDWRVEAPMTERPYMVKPEMLAWAEREGIRPQRLYEMGFPHANCGGGCVKAGIGHFVHLLKVFPQRYAEWERNEGEMQALLGQDVSILTDRAGGKRKRLTLTQLRERYEAQPRSCDLFADDWGGCGCFTEEPA